MERDPDIDAEFRKDLNGVRQITLAEIVESTGDAIISKTLDGVVTSWNKAAETIFGYTAREMIGQSVGILAAPGREAEMRSILEAIGRGERFQHLDTERRHKSGTILHVSTTVSPIRDETGALVGASEIARDITATRQDHIDLAESEARLRAIFESIPDGMILINHEGIIQSFSPAAERMFGWTEAEVRGQNVSVLMPSPDREAHDSYLNNYARTGEAQIIGIGRTVVGLRKNGETFPLELAVGEVKTDGPPSFTGFVRDISKRQATEARLREAQAELAHVSRMSAMGQMATMLAHELNQPLTAVTNYMRAGRRLLDARHESGLEKLRDALDRAGDQALRAGQIIRRLRDFMSRGDTEKQIEPIADIIEEARALALAGARQRAAKIVAAPGPCPALVLVDRIQIQQVLMNLIRNGFEATELSRAEVEIATAVHDGQIEISVIDEGAGLAPEIAERLFEPFLTTKNSGMGVGLSICRSIIEAHGGRLWYEPNPKGGTIFRFTLTVVSREEQTDD